MFKFTKQPKKGAPKEQKNRLQPAAGESSVQQPVSEIPLDIKLPPPHVLKAKNNYAKISDPYVSYLRRKIGV